ncbi:UDP-galactose-lipid carrier transferase [Bacillus coahuilensis m2-6]|uniref:polyphosphate kinase 2 family protein n=1 Tax=Bacillus coahuilensis TaxID=408580 RepID=UPI00075037F4|nr:UDP-galactose-lipid carrier transferase [Bacillus coahuilensis]KUP08408.1 UDP-galactose-lipid carrier transferase [Bacillus coahuilensis m2-6]
MNRLQQTDLSKRISSKEEYKKELKSLQMKLLRLQRNLIDQNKGCILVFEGWDAAGKGGTIKRLTEGLDPRGIEVHATAAPTQEEKKFPYLHRFWTRVPKYGKIGIFDRSWYGRVLVERIEQFATQEEWMRAYSEINDFEEYLINQDYLVLKFWIHISKEEQLKRFKERENNPLKRWKITDEDWRNREKWEEYEEAVEEMLQKTSMDEKPWYIISGEQKKYARIETLSVIVNSLEKFLEIPEHK